jgi:hypothetical protein
MPSGDFDGIVSTVQYDTVVLYSVLGRTNYKLLANLIISFCPLQEDVWLPKNHEKSPGFTYLRP